MSADAIVAAALALAPVSVGEDFDAYRQVIYPLDTLADAQSFCYGHPRHSPPIPPQFGCGMFGWSVCRMAEVDGRIRWLGREVDFLGSPYKRFVGLAPVLLEELGRQRGLLHRGDHNEQPDLSPGTILCVGGDDGLPPEQHGWGGKTHVIVVTGMWPDGTLETVEGGQIDERNGYHGTSVELKHREVFQLGNGQWWLRDAGTSERGRRVRWWMQAGDLPTIEAS